MPKQILKELKNHAPFTLFEAITGVIFMYPSQTLSLKTSYSIFYTHHPIHVLLSALVTTSMYEINECGRIRGKCRLYWKMVAGESFGNRRCCNSIFLAQNKISTCRACFIKYMDITVSYYYGKLRNLKRAFLCHYLYIPFPCCVDTLLCKWYRVSASVCKRTE